MNYTQQYNAEFDRIWKLLPEKAKIKANLLAKFDTEQWLELTINEDLVDQKALTLAKLFRTKNEKGEHVLKEGSNDNPDKTLKIIKEAIDTYPSSHGGTGLTEIELAYLGGLIERSKLYPPTLRDLFRKNCMPANDDEKDKIQIENLKLIKW